MTAKRVGPQDKELMRPDKEYCYIHCDIDYSSHTAWVRISVFDTDKRTDESLTNVSEVALKKLVNQYVAEGWKHMDKASGREYEGHYLQRSKKR